jgi:hypothetical protein
LLQYRCGVMESDGEKIGKVPARGKKARAEKA